MPYYQFPGSDFHDLNLDWLLQQMKNCLAEWAATKAEWEALSADNETFKAQIEAEWDELRQFVTDYFANLDVSQEISDKINAMAADGSLLALIESTVQSTTATATSAWLAEHVDPDTGYVIDDTLSIQNAAADAKAVGDALDDTVHLSSQAISAGDQEQARVNIGAVASDDMILLVGHKNILPGTTWTTGYFIGEDGTITSGAQFQYSSLIPVDEDSLYLLRWTKSTYAAYIRIHGYDNDGTWVKQIIVDRQTEDGDYSLIFKTDGVSQIRISYSRYYTSKFLMKAIPPVDYRMKTAYQVLPLGLHTEPRSQGVINVIKRARQMTDLKWSPAADIWRGFFEDGDTYLTSHGGGYFGHFSQGVEYTGIPYTQNRNLGTEWPIAAFASSVGIAASQEIAQSSGGTQPALTNKTSLYGVVCVTLCSYAIGVPAVNSTTWNAIPGMASVGLVSSVDANELELCDFLWYPDHVAIITDIIRDENGDAYMIEISEATRQGNANHDDTTGQNGGICRRIFMGLKEFYRWYDGFSVYRYEYLDEVPYTPCPYVPMVDESKRVASTNLPCIPIDGNFASYSSQGDREVEILINSTGYDYLLVQKDGQAFGEYAIGANTSITVTCDQDESIYTAQLITRSGGDITSQTCSCTWAIRPYSIPTITISSNDVSFSLTMKTGTWRPWYVAFGTSNSNVSDNRKNGVFTLLHPTDIVETVNGDGTSTWTWTSTRSSASQVKAGVGIVSDYFGGSYGYIVNL